MKLVFQKIYKQLPLYIVMGLIVAAFWQFFREQKTYSQQVAAIPAGTGKLVVQITNIKKKGRLLASGGV